MLRIQIKIKVLVIAFSLFLVGAFGNAFSQEIRYDDIFEKLPNLRPINAYNQFFAFQQQDPFFANTYIQLGRICELKMVEIDPLRDFEQANYWARNSVLFYNLFTAYLKEGDVRRNREYYANLVTPQPGKKIEQEDVMAFLQSRLSFCKGYCDTLAMVYGTLAKSKDHYNNSVQIFKTISNSYSSYNEALLRTDTDFLKLLDSLNVQFKASVDSFTVYQDLIGKYPLPGYKQQFALKPIETFRLDGITNSDFLDGNFTIWNYDQWVSSFSRTFHSDIVPLRKEINDIHDLFMSNRRKLTLLDTISREDKFKSFDDLFLFRLGKYDSNSLVRELFLYLDRNQELLISSKSTLNNFTDSTSALLNRKLRYYHRLALEHKKALEALGLFQKSIDSQKVENQKEFFYTHFKGYQGLSDFYNSESLSMKKLMNDNFEKLRRYLQNEKIQKMALGYSKGKQKVPQSPNYSLVGGLTNEPFIVYSVSYSQEKPNFVSGFVNKPSRKPSAFVAKIDESSTSEWVKEVGHMSSLEHGDCARFVYGFSNGCLALVSGKDGDANRNSLVRMDSKGGVILKKMLDIAFSPCFLQFDEITQSSILGFGQSVPESTGSFNSILLTLVDSVGDAVWRTTVPVKGTLVDVAKFDDRAVAFINYQSCQVDGKQMLAGVEPDSWGHLVVFLNLNNGSVEKIIPIKSAESYTISKVFAISSSEANLIGQTVPSVISPDGQMRYIVVGRNGEVVYSNL